ncbi:DUF5327 family protein [Staphylococcus canis]|uniref:DUF5327 family protein n=1 Tax=Staphylococcus canis TaxID=2724942 RepID=A0ABS0TBG8_9STAP|nr:DUF5327 family protein [Staphylococcus canis]MBI5975094.1 DUF5327 family protein [Staphylococcus canis]
MNKEKLLQLLEEELVQADESQTDTEFEKHIYAIYKLAALYTDANERSQPVKRTSVSSSTVTADEIRRMGGKVEQPKKTESTQSQRMVTDDEIGNGESIFDF